VLPDSVNGFLQFSFKKIKNNKQTMI